VKEVRSSIDIEASTDRVWAVVSDFERYPEWNPFILSIDGQPVEGKGLEVRIQPPGRRARTFRPTVIVAMRGEIRWRGRLGMPRVFDGRHSLKVEPLGPNRSRFTQYERFTGVLVPFLRGTIRATRHGFEAMNRALKARVEGGAPGP
jgi:hypothetical protein